MKTFCPCREYCGKPIPIPAGYEHMNFDSYIMDGKNRQALVAARAFCMPNGRPVYIYGEPGNGKTHLLIAALHKIMEVECSHKYAWHNVAKLAKVERNEFETREEAEDRLVEKLGRLNYLFLDDLGAENTTARTAELLYLILNDALENQRPKLFITGNQPLQYISKHISDRIASRIAGLCGLDNVIKVEGPDRRLIKGQPCAK